ncbi:MAG TPA: GNAT family N-acetyltransferase [Bacteroidales bacterium]|nr:GNAT family N-acetyltransferase [Bacteroidales bacterium]
MYKTKRPIASKIKNIKGDLYKKAAKKFNTSYGYVSMICTDPNRGQRGLGKQIKEYLEKEIAKQQR